ncbi:MAG: hypothetical protein JW993_17055 [Sedimentisphaerales bacterium]|nr:hypothetical protein [Sedimentisphaerales bacterium]
MARAIAVILAVVVTMAGTAPGGTLDKFEEDATRDRSRDDSGRDRHRSSWDDDPWDSFGGNFGAGIVNGLVIAPGQASWARVSGDENRLADLGWDPREPGDPLLPIVRFDFAYFNLQSDVEAMDYRAQVGYGPFAVELNPTFYEEEIPADDLDIYRIWGLYRMSITDRIEFDFGAGAIVLEGNETNTGFSLTTPILAQVYDWLLVEFRPIWSEINETSIDEYEAAVLLNWKSLAVKAGYRWTRSPETSLNGPFFGLSIRY